MQAAYYKEYYLLERENWWFVARKEILRDLLRRFLPENKKLRILNVGAAFGATTIMLQEFGDVTSVEYSKECCDFVNETLHLDFIHGSITELPFADGEYDLTCAFDVVEHVEEDKLAIQELHRVCKPGGFIFTTVPAFKSLWSEHDVINEHVRRYTMKNYLPLYDKAVCKIKFKSYFNFFLFFPVAIYRLVSSLVKGNKKNTSPRSDHNKIKDNFITNMLYRIFKSENWFLRKGISFPVGISIMVISQKNSMQK